MKVNLFETHDRLLDFSKQSDYISQGCEECIKNRPPEFGNHPFYIFAHKRDIGVDERIAIYNQDLQDSLTNTLYIRKYIKMSQVPSARLIWSPRLTKPKAQTNSMLFKAYPPGDNIKVMWIIPDRLMWSQYKKGNVTEQSVVERSILDFENNREKLEQAEEDDLPEAMISMIYAQISANASSDNLMGRLYSV